METGLAFPARRRMLIQAVALSLRPSARWIHPSEFSEFLRHGRRVILRNAGLTH